MFYAAHSELLTRHLDRLIVRLSEKQDPEDLLRFYLEIWNYWLLSNRRINATAAHFVSFF
jgi:hypothetical protein